MTKASYRIHFRQGEFELDVEGDRQFVESYVAAFVAGAPTEAPRPKAGHPAAKRPAAPGKRPERSAGLAPAIDGEALKAFMKGRKPKSAKERYLVYLGFLKAQGVPAASDREVKACFAADGRKAPASGRQNFSFLRNEGLVKRGAKRGLWTLTPEGEARLAPPATKGKLKRKATPAPKTKRAAAKARKAEARPAEKAKRKAAGKAPGKTVAKKAKPARAAKRAEGKTAPAKGAGSKTVKAKKARKAKGAKAPSAKTAKPKAIKPSRPKIVRVKHEPEENTMEVVPPDAMPD